MSKIGSGWSLVGQWFGDVCIAWPIMLAVLGLLIALAIGALSWTGVGVTLAWVLFWIDIGILVLIAILVIGGTLFTAGQFLTDMLDNFFSNLWTTGSISSAWKSLTSDVTSCGSAFMSGVKKAVAPIGSVVGELRKLFGF